MRKRPFLIVLVALGYASLAHAQPHGATHGAAKMHDIAVSAHIPPTEDIPPFPLQPAPILGPNSMDAELDTPVDAPSLIPPDITIPVKSIAPRTTIAILGMPVALADGGHLGRIVDVLINAQGLPQAAVLDVGGFLGMGNRQVAVGWEALHFSPARDHDQAIIISVRGDDVRSAPEYRDSRVILAVIPPPPPASMPLAENGAADTFDPTLPFALRPALAPPHLP